MGIGNLDKNKIPGDRNEINEASRNGNILEAEFENDFLVANENMLEEDAYENVIEDEFENDFLVSDDDENTMDIGKYLINIENNFVILKDDIWSAPRRIQSPTTVSQKSTESQREEKAAIRV